jgi:hypothetical protein
MTKAKINNTLRTLAPLGKWTGVIFSEELENAIRLYLWFWLYF